MFFNHYINKSLEDFIQENDKLMWQVAHDFKKRNSYLMSRSGSKLEDMYSETKIYFIKCYNSYNGKREFSTYFYKSAMLGLKSYVDKNNGLIRVTHNYAHRKEMKKLHSYNPFGNKNLTVEEVMHICELNKEVAKRVKTKYEILYLKNIGSLNKKVSEDVEIDIIEMINSNINTENICIYNELNNNFRKKLNEKQIKVLDLKLNNYKNVEIADLMGVSRQYIFQICNQIKNKYNKYKEAEEFYFI